ncbi:hypothetical protein AAHE18_12G063300 [Arachis hypogaea]
MAEQQDCKYLFTGLLFVAGSQPVNALAFVVDGLYYGVSDFGFAAYSMVLVALISSVFILVASPVLGLPGVWTGLFLFIVLRVLARIWSCLMKVPAMDELVKISILCYCRVKGRELNWEKRYDIIIGTAEGLVYLHENSKTRIIQRDIKASNILLDAKLRAKIICVSDFQVSVEHHSQPLT